MSTRTPPASPSTGSKFTLDELAQKYGTDKSSEHHNYAVLYERYLQGLPELGALLELGVFKGGSLRMWRGWLPLWKIVGLDIEPKNKIEGITILEGDQAEPLVTTALGETHGPFDVIIDDASHLSSLTIASFEQLWPFLKPGGWYVVEDTHMAYHEQFYGQREARFNPDQRPHGAQRTAMQFLRRLADEANFDPASKEGDLSLFPREFWLGYEVEEVHFHYNICFVRKRA